MEVRILELRLHKLLGFIGKAEFVASAIMLVTILIAMSSDAISRYLLGKSLSFASALCGLLMVWLGFMTASIAFKEKSHISVSFFVERLPDKARKILGIIEEVLIIGALFFAIESGLKLQSLQGLQVIPGLGISRKYLSIAVVVGGLSMALTSLVNIVEKINLLRNNE